MDRISEHVVGPWWRFEPLRWEWENFVFIYWEGKIG